MTQLTSLTLPDVIWICWQIIFWGMSFGIIFIFVFSSCANAYFRLKADFVKAIVTKEKENE